MLIETKAAVSVAEMARMVGLSRPRFYQLIGTAFPWPVYDVSTKRPFYDEEAQRSCLAVRRRNSGIDGKPIMFYARRLPTAPSSMKSRPSPPRKKSEAHAEVIGALRSLGLSSVTNDQVAAVLKEAFPNGTTGVDQSEVIRTVFVRIKRQNSSNKLA